jgi:alpha-L-rhamnosidase
VEEMHLSRTDPYLISTASFLRSARTLAETARVLGKDADRERYAALAEEVRRAFVARYVGPDGLAASDTQTAYALMLDLDVAPEHRTRLAERLVELVEESGGTLATGFIGTPLICAALVGAGRTDLAYELLLQRSCPSWLYTVTMGATTMWERWDSLQPDGSVNPGSMTSFNHYAFGAIADWLYDTVAGIVPTDVGFRSVRVAPRPGGSLRHVAATHLTPYGPLSVSWRRDEEGLGLDVSVPVGVTATVDLPSGEDAVLGHGRHHLRVPAGVPLGVEEESAGAQGRPRDRRT